MFTTINAAIRYLKDRGKALVLILKKVDCVICDSSDRGFGIVLGNRETFLSLGMDVTLYDGPAGKKAAKVRWTRKFQFMGKEFQRVGLQFISVAHL